MSRQFWRVTLIYYPFNELNFTFLMLKSTQRLNSPKFKKSVDGAIVGLLENRIFTNGNDLYSKFTVRAEGINQINNIEQFTTNIFQEYFKGIVEFGNFISN